LYLLYQQPFGYFLLPNFRHHINIQLFDLGSCPISLSQKGEARFDAGVARKAVHLEFGIEVFKSVALYQLF
jgi:hypothetical protein